MNSPLVFPTSVGAREAQRRSAPDGRPVVHWWPGCAYCPRLRLRPGRRARRPHLGLVLVRTGPVFFTQGRFLHRRAERRHLPP
ncbi:hypothetical protein ACIF9R_21325 [Streptomyces sp. NPDC086080]|uniref:hypothetical protein n=1 Tax=Streptomyces sp. NPDC086080 TaxID=3365748 RepID=UPI0037D48F7A